VTLSEITDLLVRADSICSLIYYREGTALSDRTRQELNELCADLRAATNTLGGSHE
jgi:hypothetical protein